MNQRSTELGPDSTAEITELLREAQCGSNEALERVTTLVYDDLARLADRHIRSRYRTDPKAITLEPAALVNETFLDLIKQRNQYDNRGHFFAIATRLMLRVLMRYDRAKRQMKRGGDRVRVTLSGIEEVAPGKPAADIATFVDALERLEDMDPRSADVAKLRLVWGLTPAESARSLGVSLRTIEREWRFARTWLADELGP